MNMCYTIALSMEVCNNNKFCIINLYVIGLVSSCSIIPLPEGSDVYSYTSRVKVTWTQVCQSRGHAFRHSQK